MNTITRQLIRIRNRIRYLYQNLWLLEQFLTFRPYDYSYIFSLNSQMYRAMAKDFLRGEKMGIAQMRDVKTLLKLSNIAKEIANDYDMDFCEKRMTLETPKLNEYRKLLESTYHLWW